ncbi:unnamed protein product [Owenia fusiformis]|uniref:SUMO-activating enzyme subunit 1 n=1 Tax=Owenia fusiformis TaxID=6347 RepID=A0A8S4PCB1_OWEFU|nr:unnamed protein product [Owenia fusiformis]
MSGDQSVDITENEAELYDRQIRLWGLDAQKRLRAARVLLIGLRGLGAEVAKNIVLAGIKSITLMDHTIATEEDVCAQFLIDRSDIGKNRAESSLTRTQLLNPMVEMTADKESVDDKSDEFFKNFDVICATCCSQEQLLRVNEISFANNIKFFAGDVYGYYGYMFSDLNDHKFAEEITKRVKKDSTSDSGEPQEKKAKTEELETVTVERETSFVRLKEALNVDWTSEAMVRRLKRTPNTYFIMQVLHAFRSQEGRQPTVKEAESDKEKLLKLRDAISEQLHIKPDIVGDDFASHCVAELSPVCAILGGILGGEVIKAVSQKDVPHNNFFFYNGVEGSGMRDKSVFHFHKN